MVKLTTFPRHNLVYQSRSRTRRSAAGMGALRASGLDTGETEACSPYVALKQLLLSGGTNRSRLCAVADDATHDNALYVGFPNALSL